MRSIFIISTVLWISFVASDPEDQGSPFDNPRNSRKSLDRMRMQQRQQQSADAKVNANVNSLTDESTSYSTSSSSSSFPFLASLASTLDAIATDSPSFANVTKQCSSTLKEIFAKPNVSTAILDAFGKPRAGITQGALAWPGNYDQCVGYTGRAV